MFRSKKLSDQEQICQSDINEILLRKRLSPSLVVNCVEASLLADWLEVLAKLKLVIRATGS
jgi:hypothetical protein